MKIHYITSWGENFRGMNLEYSPAGLSKAKYVVKSIRDNGFDIRVASFTYIKRGVVQLQPVYYGCDEDGNSIRFCASYPHFTVVGGIIQRFFIQIQLFFYLLFHVKENDVVVVYHERYYHFPIKLAKLITKRQIILEIEELYTVAGNFPKRLIDKEISQLSIADGYILINDIISDYCHLDKYRPSVVCYGKYDLNSVQKDSFEDGQIHVLYSGIIDTVKGGVWAALKAFCELPEGYSLHIAGFGNEEDVNALKGELLLLPPLKQEKVQFHGCLNQKQLEQLMHKCHIGLCTHDPTKELNKTSFASKILNYLSNGLLVVAGRNKTLERSAINDLLYYYDRQTPQAIASTILSVKANSDIVEKSINRLSQLDREFKIKLKGCIIKLAK